MPLGGRGYQGNIKTLGINSPKSTSALLADHNFLAGVGPLPGPGLGGQNRGSSMDLTNQKFSSNTFDHPNQPKVISDKHYTLQPPSRNHQLAHPKDFSSMPVRNLNIRNDSSSPAHNDNYTQGIPSASNN